MKHFIATVILGLGLGHAALAGTAPVGNDTNSLFYNANFVTNPPVLDEVSFVNAGELDFATTPYPYMTKGTYFYTNLDSGILLAIPGWEFDHGVSSYRNSASSFLNQGTVDGVDGPATITTFSVAGSPNAVVAPALDLPASSQVLVFATNIVNTGAMSVGNVGLLNLVGSNVTTTFGTLVAGSVSDADPLNTTGLTGQEESVGSGNDLFFDPTPNVYDVFWGITNGDVTGVDGLSMELPNGIPNVATGMRPNAVGLALPANANAQFSVYAYSNYVVTATATGNTISIYYNIIFLNTNFAGANITGTAGFTVGEDVLAIGKIDPNAVEDIVQFSEPVYDIITGQTVTNSIYLMDDGAYLPTMTLEDNATLPTGFDRPNAFEVTTLTPVEWAEATPGNSFFDPALMYTAGEFNNNMEPLAIAEYGAQIGHNPADIAGSFASLTAVDSDAYVNFVDLPVVLPDPTNESARIQMSAVNLDISQSRMRAEGMVILNATNLIGGGNAILDWGEANANIGVNSGVLNVSNIFPTNFQRLRGDIYAASVNWQNTQTNTVPTPNTTNTTVTNFWHYHVLVVDQNLYGSFPSVVRNLTLNGKNSIVLNDGVSVINQAVFNTTNLTLQSSNYFSQNAENFTSANTPYMKNLFINTNGFLGAQSLLNVGFNAVQGPTAPGGRAYSVNTITNFGQMSALVPQLQSVIFENDGTITANSIGSILIEASNLCLGLALPDTTNYLQAGGDVELSALTIQASNSVINAGLSEPASLTLNAVEQLTDFVSGTPTTNTSSVIMNYWTANGGGFSLPVKPASGDLFGTQITAAVTTNQAPEIVWAGDDRGATAAGFVNNEVIGRLVLDRQASNSLLRINAAGTRNAMYVDYLCLTNYAYTNYRSGLEIGTGLTVYFAACNADPVKLTNTIPGLVWVPGFAGPNSSVPITYANSSIVFYLNTNVADSSSIAFWNNIPNYDLLNGLDEMAPYTNLLNNPTNVNQYLVLQGTYSFPGSFTPGANAESFLLGTTNKATGAVTLDLLALSYNGQGSITLTGQGSTTPITSVSQLVWGNSYTLTARPAAGWVFDNSIIAGPGGMTTNSLTNYTFAFTTNTEIVVNFMPTPYPASEGVYNGLFFETNAVDSDSAGAVTLTMTKTGKFSGKLRIGPGTYTFTSQFSGSGAAQFLAKSGAHSLTVNLQLDLTQTGEIYGDVTNSNEGWDAILAADLEPTWTAKNPSPLTGSYTMVLPWDTGTEAANEAGGDSYSVGAVSKLGVLTLAGALADGATFSTAAPVSAGGQWPFYVYSASGKDTVLGWVSLTNRLTGLAGTNISWSKASGKGLLYAAGFSNVLQLIGSPWQAPTKSLPALILTGPAVFLSGGDLPESLTDAVTTKNSLTYSASNVSLTISSSTGKFSGWFENPFTKKKQTISGVVLTNAVSARGYFSGTNQSGAVLLQSQ